MRRSASVILFIVPCLVFGQTRHADSLATHHYEEVYKTTIYSDKAAAKMAIDSLGAFAKQSHYPEATYYYHFLLADYYFSVHGLSLSEEHYHQALRTANQLRQPQKIVHSKIWLGNLDHLTGKYLNATRWYNEAYALAEETSYVEGMCDALFGLAGMERDYRKKLEKYIQIESLYTRHNQISPVLANTYGQIGNLYLNSLDDVETATRYFEKALSMSKLTGYPYGISEVNRQLGELALSEGDLERAKGYFEDLYAENITRKDSVNQMHTLVQLAEVDRRLGNYKEAESKVLKATAYYVKKNGVKNDDVTALVGARLLLAQIYLGMHKPNLSKVHLDYANRHYHNSEDTLASKIKLLATEVDYYRALQLFEKALSKQQAIDEAKTLQANLANEERFFELEAQYRTSQKEHQIEMLSAENQLVKHRRQNQSRLFVAVTVLMLVVGLALWFAYRNKLRTAQKVKELNAMKSRFFANISHEFRTPLTLIKSPLQSLQGELADKHQRKQLTLIDKSADRMLELVDQLLELSKLDSGNLELKLNEGNVGLFLKSVAEPFAYQANEKGFIYTSDIGVCDENHEFDKDVVEKIVTNLLSNALKYTPEKQHINFTSTVANGQLNIRVSNSVQGMQKSDVPKFFERFYQNKAAHEGFGVGLALVKELVELYDGTINSSLANKTLHFEVTLPLVRQREESIVVPMEGSHLNVAHHHGSGGTGKVHRLETLVDQERPVLLVVDDNAEIRNLLKDLFSADYTVLEAANGKAALALAQKEIPDCIVSDVMMPKMDGFEFTKRIKDNELTSFIPVVVLTAKSTERAHLESLECTADAFLTKPFHNEILKETVARQIAERKKLRERYSRELILKPVDIAINTVDEKFLEKLGVVMNKNLSDANFSTDDFAAELGMSRMQLHRKLKSLLNVSTTEFIRNERLKSAVELISKGHKTVSEVAYAVGFNDVSYFSKCFKELYCVTPTEYIDEAYDQSVAR